MELFNYINLCDAFVQLMDPLLEIVIHDLASEKIHYINGKLSGRKIGDPSLLDLDTLDKDNLKNITYTKLNFDGRLIKSISVPVDDNWLICINCDISIFHKMNKVASLMLKETSAPESLFKNDWQEQLNITIHAYLAQKSWSFNHLTLSQKKSVVHYLFREGAFSQKNAADYIAKILNMGRATIFNYLKEWRNNENV